MSNCFVIETIFINEIKVNNSMTNLRDQDSNNINNVVLSGRASLP